MKVGDLVTYGSWWSEMTVSGSYEKPIGIIVKSHKVNERKFLVLWNWKDYNNDLGWELDGGLELVGTEAAKEDAGREASRLDYVSGALVAPVASRRKDHCNLLKKI